MSTHSVIRSRSNSLLKRVAAISGGRERSVCLLEGDRLIDDAAAAGWEFEVILVSETREERARELEQMGLEVRRVEHEHLARVSELDTSPGILAIAPIPAQRNFESLDTDMAPRVLVIAGIADPGNLGAVCRSAEAAGFQHVIVLAGSAYPFGSKSLRGSMGSLLRLDLFEAADASALAQHLRRAGYRQVTAATRGGTDWRTFDWSEPIAIWATSETGVAPEIVKTFEGVTIPMAGAVESLNITVATSLLLFAVRSSK